MTKFLVLDLEDSTSYEEVEAPDAKVAAKEYLKDSNPEVGQEVQVINIDDIRHFMVIKKEFGLREVK